MNAILLSAVNYRALILINVTDLKSEISVGIWIRFI